MKGITMKKGLISAIGKKSLTLLALLIFLYTGAAADAKEKQGKLLGYVVIPDIVQTLGVMEKIAAVIDPARFQPGALKGQAGMILGDPKFENIDRTKPLVVMIFQQAPVNKSAGSGRENISFAVFIPAKDKARYKKIFDGMNMSTVVKNNILIVSNKMPALADAQKETDLYLKITSQKLKTDIRLLLKIDSVMSAYSKEISGFTGIQQSLENQQSGNIEQQKQIAPFLALGKLFVYGMMDMAAQSKDYQLDIALSEKNVIFSSEHSAKPGTPLSSFYDGNPPGVNRCISLLPEKGDLTYAGYFDMKRFKEFINSTIAGAVKRDPAISKDLDMKLIEEYKKMLDLYKGEFAFIYGFSKTSKFEMHIAASTERSGEEHLAMNESFIKIYNDAVKKMSGGAAGISTYTIEKNVRKSSGYDIHRYLFKMDYSVMSEKEKEIIQKMLGEEFSIEFAVANGYLVSSTNPKTLDKIITNTKTGGATMELQSMKVFGPGMDSYIDFDVIGFIEKIALLSKSSGNKENNPVIDDTLKMMKKLTPEERVITASAKYSKGTSYNRYQLSVKMITDIVKFGMEQKAKSYNTEQPVYNPESQGAGEQ